MARPAKKWTHSQRRQLVRLYTLTSLSSSEIRDLLEANGFKVRYGIKSSIIRTIINFSSLKTLQNMLHSLFPRDYTKEYSRYRPRSLAHMKSRLDLVKKISTGRVSNPRKYLRKQSRRNMKYSRPTSFMGGIIERAEGPSQEPLKVNQSTETSTLSIHLQDAHLINTRMLMLDGSMMEYKTSTNFEPSPNCSKKTHSVNGTDSISNKFSSNHS